MQTHTTCRALFIVAVAIAITLPANGVGHDQFLCDLIVHRARTGHTLINGNALVVLTPETVGRPILTHGISTSLPVSVIAKRKPVRSVDLITRIPRPITVRVDPRRYRQVDFRPVLHDPVRASAAVMRPLGGVTITPKNGRPTVNSVIELDDLRVRSAPSTRWTYKRQDDLKGKKEPRNEEKPLIRNRIDSMHRRRR